MIISGIIYSINNFTSKFLHGRCCKCPILFIELLFVFVEAVFVASRSEELGIAT